jgi:hypothetical protein
MFCSKHVEVKRHSVYFPEVKKNICRIFFGFEFISFPNRGLLSAAPCIIVSGMHGHENIPSANPLFSAIIMSSPYSPH